MEKIIWNHDKTGNINLRDSWSSYIWLNAQISGYIHSIHNLVSVDFGVRLDNNSNIEYI